MSKLSERRKEELIYQIQHNEEVDIDILELQEVWKQPQDRVVLLQDIQSFDKMCRAFDLKIQEVTYNQDRGEVEKIVLRDFRIQDFDR